MARARNRADVCPRCHKVRAITVNLDTKQVIDTTGPETCFHPRACIEEMRDKALLAQFEDGKTRRR